MKVEQKLIRVQGNTNDNFDYLDDDLLNEGFVVKQISASIINEHDCCYVLYERLIDEEKPQKMQTKSKSIFSCHREFENYLEELFKECSCRLIFHHRILPSEDVFYIGFEDMKKKQYTIRKKAGNTFDEINDPIIESYQSIHDILSINRDLDKQWVSELEDGWMEDWWVKFSGNP